MIFRQLEFITRQDIVLSVGGRELQAFLYMSNVALRFVLKSTIKT